MLVNQDWINVCQSSSVSTLTKLRSDHYPLLFEFQTQSSPFTSSFKFMKMWISHPDCINVVKQCWNNQIIGCPMLILSQKLKMLKEALKLWNKNTFGDVHSQVTLVSYPHFGPKNTLSNFLLFSNAFKFTVFSTVLQLHTLLFQSFKFLHKIIQKGILDRKSVV